MFTIRRHIELDAGHRVPFHAGHCRHLHGHRYKVTLVVEAAETVRPDQDNPEAGMVADFGVLKHALMTHVHSVCDHKLLLWEHDPLVKDWRVYPHPIENPFQKMLLAEMIGGGVVRLPCIPTAEELARYWGELLVEKTERVWHERLWIAGVEVQETPTSLATWTRPPRVTVYAGEEGT